MGSIWNVMLAKGVTPRDGAFAPVRDVLARNDVSLTPVKSLKGAFTLNANGNTIENSRASAIIDEMMLADREGKIIDGALLIDRQPQPGR